MVSITLITDENKKLRVEYATSWDELNLGQLMQLERGVTDPVEKFSILTGVPQIELDQSKQKDLENLIYAAVYFLSEQPDWKKLPVPDKVVIGDKVIKIPKRLGQEPLGQKVMFDQIIAQSEGMVDVIPKALAIYFQPLIFGGKFDRTKLEETEKLLMEQPALPMYSIANFFLKSPKNLRKLGTLGFHLLKNNLTKHLKVSQGSIDSSHLQTSQLSTQ